MKKKVLLLVLNDFTHDIRPLKEAVSLKEAGYNVRVLAVTSRGLPAHEVIQQIEVDRLQLKTTRWIGYQPGKANAAQLIVMYTEMLVQYMWALITTYRNCDIIHAHAIQALPLGVFYKIFVNRKSKLIYDCHEYETEQFSKHGLPKLIAKVIEKTLIRFADEILVVSESIAQDYEKLYKIPKLHVIFNCPPRYHSVEKYDLFRQKFAIQPSQKIFLYQGGLASGRGVELLLQVFRSLDPQKYVLIFLGYGPLEAEIIRASQNSQNIFFHPAVKPNDLLRYTSSADYGFALIEDKNLSFRYCLPNKLFEYIQAGIPVLVSNRTEMRQFVSTHPVGEIIESDDRESVRVAMDRILAKGTEYFKNDLRLAAEKFNWQEQEKILLQIYEGLRLSC
ncbi:MAG: glycosyltransferase [Candidatus Omnitrophica bacterium]|nr:glycosyltransferase [Candidatus Omnitrophota bacterium]